MTAADVQTKLRDGVVLASVTGVIDLANAEDVGSCVIGKTPAEARGLVLDLSRVEFLDSVAITVIIGVRERLAERRQSLALVVPETSLVRGTFEVVGLLQHLHAADTVDDALRAIGSAEGSA